MPRRGDGRKGFCLCRAAEPAEEAFAFAGGDRELWVPAAGTWGGSLTPLLRGAFCSPRPHREMARRRASGSLAPTGGWQGAMPLVPSPPPGDGKAPRLWFPRPHREMARRHASGSLALTGGWQGAAPLVPLALTGGWQGVAPLVPSPPPGDGKAPRLWFPRPHREMARRHASGSLAPTGRWQGATPLVPSPSPGDGKAPRLWFPRPSGGEG